LKHPVENKHCEDLKKEEEKHKSKRPKLVDKQQTIGQMLRKTKNIANHQLSKNF